MLVRFEVVAAHVSVVECVCVCVFFLKTSKSFPKAYSPCFTGIVRAGMFQLESCC